MTRRCGGGSRKRWVSSMMITDPMSIGTPATANSKNPIPP
jgi:hypothetical protein